MLVVSCIPKKMLQSCITTWLVWPNQLFCIIASLVVQREQKCSSMFPETGSAIVKLWCLPVPDTGTPTLPFTPFVKPILDLIKESSADGPGEFNYKERGCNETLDNETMKTAVAMRRIAEQCGMESIIQEVSRRLSPL